MDPVAQLQTALALLAIEPRLGGALIRARVGPGHAYALAAAKRALPFPSAQLHPSMGREALDGSIDVTNSLAEGALVQSRGILDGTRRTLYLPMAERCEPLLAARLAKALEQPENPVVIALDEGANAGEACPEGLADRLAFHIRFDAVPLAGLTPALKATPAPNAAAPSYDPDLPEQLITLCVTLGIQSLRAASHALRAAQAHARLQGRAHVAPEDVEAAVVLTLAPRATQLPEPPPEEPPQEERHEQAETSDPQKMALPDEILLEAVKAALPEDLLSGLPAGRGGGAGSGSGAKRLGNRRGRPLPPRGQRSTSGARVDMIATLRAAVPWQTLRKAAQPDRQGPIILPSDLRHKRYQDLSDRLLIFAVDASGSAALARLAEAKGAVELLLAQAYARRDHVTLIAFRGTGAETLLPPTRSLVQTKRRLAALPGGGGTPLAAGLQEAAIAAQHAQQKGLTPTIVLLTDGRANIALSGAADRKAAAEDAATMATRCAQTGAEAIVIDTGNRPEASLRQLAQRLNGAYLSLPRADAQKLSASVRAQLDG